MVLLQNNKPKITKHKIPKFRIKALRRLYFRISTLVWGELNQWGWGGGGDLTEKIQGL